MVSYKWLARHFSVSANRAKQILFAFQEEHHETVKATFFLSGWTQGENKEHVVLLVSSADLPQKKALLDPVTSMHVYSVQPSQPKVGNIA